MIHFVVPVHVRTKDNQRGHWGPRHAQDRKEREATRIAWLGVGSPPPRTPCAITLIRVASRPLDTQNMGSALKSVIDELAQGFGWRSDRESGVEWLFEQRAPPPAARGPRSWVEVRIEEYAFQPAPDRDAARPRGRKGAAR